MGARILEKAVKPTEGNALKASECLPNYALHTIQTTMRREIKYVTSKSVEEKIKRNKGSIFNSNKAVKKRKERKKIPMEHAK